jgi:membrane-associated protein
VDQVSDFVLASAAFPWIYALVFAWVLIDAFFPPVPSDVVVVGLTALSISAGVPNKWALALVAALGAIAGDNISYEIGRRIGVQRWRWMKGPRAERAIGSARTSLQRRPVVLMLTARYVAIGRVAVTMVAGRPDSIDDVSLRSQSLPESHGRRTWSASGCSLAPGPRPTRC